MPVVVLNLAGYVVGTLILSPVADRVGRRNMLMVTMGLTGLGSLYNALAPDYTQFVMCRCDPNAPGLSAATAGRRPPEARLEWTWPRSYPKSAELSDISLGAGRLSPLSSGR
jgi:MFS family permease